MQERRKYKRVPIHSIMMYQVQRDKDLANIEYKRINTLISIDISIGGVQVVTREKINEGAYLKLLVNLEGKNLPIIVIGKVVWIRNTDNEGSRKMGIEFVEFSDIDDKKNIEEFVNTNL